MPNQFKKIISLHLLLPLLLIGAGLYLACSLPAVNAASNDFILAWSSDSYTPPNYEGKALPTIGSTVKIVVMPVKKLAQNTDSLTYLWVLDGEQAYASQGVGKSSFQFQITKWNGESHEIEARVLDNKEAMLWRGFLTIQISKPEVLIGSPASNYSLTTSLAAKTGQEVNLVATPLFFRAIKPSDLLFDWQLDGQTLTPALKEQNPEKLVIKIPAGDLAKTLSKNLSLIIQHKTNQFQQSSASLILEISK